MGWFKTYPIFCDIMFHGIVTMKLEAILLFGI